MAKVACIGDIAIDDYVNLNVRFVGGISFNVAWNLSRLGVGAEVFSAVGYDRGGAEVLTAVAHTGLSTRTISRFPGVTARQRIIVSDGGERKFDGYTPGVLSQLSDHIVVDQLPLERFDAVHVPLSDGMELLFQSVAHKSSPCKKIADFSVDATVNGGLETSLTNFCPYFDLVFIGGSSEDEILVRRLAQEYPSRIFVLTLGRLGSRGFKGPEEYFQEAVPVERVADSTGCGDAFQAGFITHWLSDLLDVKSALHAGAIYAAKVAGRIGATECILN
jgi:sugar/nucleoside kinase (ribokinase family)